MKVNKNIVKENFAFELKYSDYNVTKWRSVTWNELKDKPIGTEFAVDTDDSCGRANDETTATIVYRDISGCAVIFRRFGTTDDSNPEFWSDDPELKWFEFNDD